MHLAIVKGFGQRACRKEARIIESQDKRASLCRRFRRRLHMVGYITRIAVFAGLVAISSMARADIYRCIDADGTTLYSDAPCPLNAKAKANITEEVGACSTPQCEEQ